MIFDAIIFDIDGILVDVSKSYREAIRQTASYFFKRSVTMNEVSEIKNKIGMNNDWDASYALINNPGIAYATVKSYFQSLYLGSKDKKGLIDNERILIPKAKLQLLKKKYSKLGIATGRPRNEALYVIAKNKLQNMFDCIVAMEDVIKGKPAPDMLLKVIQQMKLKKTVYIGDSPSDVIASEKAGIPCLYVGKLQIRDITSIKSRLSVRSKQNIGTKRFDSVLQVVKYLL